MSLPALCKDNVVLGEVERITVKVGLIYCCVEHVTVPFPLSFVVVLTKIGCHFVFVYVFSPEE